MKLDLIEIANIPYRNHKAEIYSASVRKRYKLKGIIYSILLALIFGIFFGFCHIKSVTGSDSAEIIGIYEIYDTGFGKHLDGIGSSIKAGKTIDVYFEHDSDGKRFIKEHGNEVFIQVVKAQG